MKTMHIKINFLEPILGTWPADPQVAEKYIASKAPDAATITEEIAATSVEEVTEKAMTIFPRNEAGQPVLYDYQIKGFFKDACGMLARVKSTKSSKIKSYKKIIDGLIFTSPRMIPLDLRGEIGNCQRPLRAQTAQGERVSLANSEELPAGTKAEFYVDLLDEAHEDLVLEWLEYGKLRGLGQWRNSGKGRFEFEVLE